MRSSRALVLILLACSVSATAQIEEIIKQVDNSLQQRDTSGLSDNKIIAGLKQALEPLRGLLPIADQECQRQFGLRDSIAHLGPPKTAWSVSPQTRGPRHAPLLRVTGWSAGETGVAQCVSGPPACAGVVLRMLG